MLWARVNVLFEERWEGLLGKYERSGKRRNHDEMALDDDDAEGREWEEDVKTVLGSMENVQVSDG